MRATISTTAAQIEDFVVSRNLDMTPVKSPSTRAISSGFKRVDAEPLRPLSSEMNSQHRDEELSFNESFDRLKVFNSIIFKRKWF